LPCSCWGVTLNQEFDLTADLQKPKAERTRIGRYYSILQEECEREISLINDLLDLQRLDVGNHPVQPEPILLDAWLSGWIDSFVTRAKSRDQSLRLVTAPTLPVLHTDLAIWSGCWQSYSITPANIPRRGAHYPQRCRSGRGPRRTDSDRPHQHRRHDSGGGNAPHLRQVLSGPSADPWKQGGRAWGWLGEKAVMHLEGDIEVTSDENQTCFTITLPTQIALTR
jgi:signal transduction histidine kinase